MDNRHIFRVTIEDISACDINDAADSITTLEKEADEGSFRENHLVFDCSEIEEEKGANWFTDPQVREFFEALDREFPHIPVFFGSSNQYKTYTMIFVPFHLEGRKPRFERQELERFALKKIEAIQYFCKQHGLNCKDAIRDFCSELGLDLLVATESKGTEQDYPFDAERVTSEFLLEFFKTNYYCHMIDSSDEPVLFSLVDDPAAAYYADTDIEIELFKGDTAPVILLNLNVYDIPDNPLKMAFLYNVATDRHIGELNAYAEKNYITLNVLFKDEKEDLWYGFTRMIDLPGALRERIGEIVSEASEYLLEIPEDSFDFNAAVHRYLMEEDGEEFDDEEPEDESDVQEEFSIVEEEIPETAPEDSDEKPDRPERPERPEKRESQEFEVRRSPKPTKPRRDRSQRLNRVLLKPTRRPSRDVTDRMAVTMGDKRVVSRNEDRVERLSRRVIILENKLMQKERESLRFQEDLRLAKEQIRFLEQENLELEKRWWKFWK